MSVKVGVVIIAKNEEKFIAKTIESLLEQDLKPYRIILVDDGSTDKTSEIASKYPIEIIKREKRKEFLQGKKELTHTINDGLKKFDNDLDCEFIVKLDADNVLPKNYISTCIQKMSSSNIVVSSGAIEGEYTITPRGGGRVVNMAFWRKLGLRYPVNYGFEGYLLCKAQQMGYEVKVFDDLEIYAGKKTGSSYNPDVYYYYGIGMKAIGYTIPYALIRALKLGLRKPKAATKMLSGFFSKYDDLYEEDLRNWVRKYQHNKLTHLKLTDLKRIFKS
jgi:glycosyltransferase involved in cell wall biosynthesis